MIHTIILAGGKGKRLWPLSTPRLPKPFVSIDSGPTLLQQAVARFGKSTIVTAKEYVQVAKEQAPFCNVIGEKSPRGTLVALLFAIRELGLKEGDVVAMCPADHAMGKIDFDEAKDLAKQGYIVAFGARPSRAECGYGYIETSKGSVVRFIEKPSKSVAKTLWLRSGVYWNMGIYVVEVGTLLREVGRYGMPSGEVSIDKAVVEKSDRVACIPYNESWSDVGSWESLIELYGAHEERDGSAIFGSNRPIRLEGVSGLIVVDSPDGLLIKRRG